MKKSKIIVLVSLLFFVIIGNFAVSKFIDNRGAKTEKKEKPAVWQKSDTEFDLLAGDGKMINFEKQPGGIIILPKGYEEKKKDVVITVTDIKSNSKKKRTILKDIPEFTAVKFIKNQINGSKLWFTVWNSSSNCAKTDKNSIQSSCSFQLYELDVETGKVTLKKEIGFWVGKAISGVYPLIHDPKNNIVWIGIDYEDVKHQVFKKDGKVIYVEARITDFVKYDANTSKESLISIDRTLYGYPVGGSWTPFGVGINGKIKIADVDNNGDLFVVTSCGLQCSDGELSTEKIELYRISSGKLKDTPQFEPLSVFFYNNPLNPGIEIAIDRSKQILYLYLSKNELEITIGK